METKRKGNQRDSVVTLIDRRKKRRQKEMETEDKEDPDIAEMIKEDQNTI